MVYQEDRLQCGVLRPTMGKNVLITQAELGKVKPRGSAPAFTKETTFGVSKPRDQEGAREVSGTWVEHTPNPDQVPGPDFKAMNKAATIRECVTSKEHTDFRQGNMICLKGGEKGKLDRKAVLPSSSDPEHTYGRMSCMRPVEETRYTGDAPDIKSIVQGQFIEDWVKVNDKRSEYIARKQESIPPRATKASEGHALASVKPAESSEPFKLSKFKKVESKVGR